ncbi:hypothetical protein B0H19DRAFT_1382661 [Mycena capillaripes]|nr:hypothetical protein B0H19DRAFT_1382661 [Mycena capillaripes]
MSSRSVRGDRKEVYLAALEATFTATLSAYRQLTALDLSNFVIDSEFRMILSSFLLLQDLALARCEITFAALAEIFVFGNTFPLRSPDPNCRSRDAAEPNSVWLPRRQLHRRRAHQLAEKFVRFLDCCPALEYITIIPLSSAITLPQHLPDTTIPILESFMGPATFAAVFGLSPWPTTADPGAEILAFVQDITGASVVLRSLSIDSRKAVRTRNAASIASLPNSYGFLSSAWIGNRTAGAPELELTAPDGWTAAIRVQLLALGEEMHTIRALTELAKWEGSIRGKWPAAEYTRLVDVQVEMIVILVQAHLSPSAVQIVSIVCGAAPVVLQVESAAEPETSCSLQATKMQATSAA